MKMEDQDLMLIGAKHSTAGQFSREFTEDQWLAAAREIQAAERERCAKLCTATPWPAWGDTTEDLRAALAEAMRGA